MISLPSQPLRDALSRARLVANRTSGNTIFASVVLNARPENAWLTITAASIDAQIALDVDADVTQAVNVCVDAEKLSQALQASGDSAKLSLDGERLKIAIGRSVFRIPTQPTDNFPLLASEGERLASFECAWLGPTLKRVLPFTGSADNPHTYARGVALTGANGAIRVDGTTGGMLASVSRAVPGCDEFTVMLPRRIAEIIEAVAPTRAVIKTATSLFLGENMQLHAKHLAAVLPDLTRAFPAPGKRFKVNRAEFASAVKNVSSMADTVLRKWKIVRVECDGLGTCVISAGGVESDARADLAYEGDVFDWHYDSSLLLAMAAEVSGDDLELIFDARGCIMVTVDDGRFAGMMYRA